jgi:NAD(P)-dependent dehydrogenase (short-subunit alcohol dehydrogenase family)
MAGPVDLTGQVALVTGATSGLGRRFAVVLAEAGAKVGLVGRRPERLAETAAEIAAFGSTSLVLPADLASAETATEVVRATEAQLGPVTILVNNAAMPDAMYAAKMPLDLVDAVIHTNFRAPFVLSCEVARRLIALQRPGRIVNVSSMSSFYYTGEAAALYSMTKAAVNRMTETLAVEWARFHINVNGIAPGAFDTEMMQGMVERVGDMTAGYPRRRMGEPYQLDTTLLYLVDPRSDFVTGTIIKVDDGQIPR